MIVRGKLNFRLVPKNFRYGYFTIIKYVIMVVRGKFNFRMVPKIFRYGYFTIVKYVIMVNIEMSTRFQLCTYF